MILVALIVAITLWVGPFVVLWRITVSRAAPPVYILWGLLGWIGVVIGLITIPKARV